MTSTPSRRRRANPPAGNGWAPPPEGTAGGKRETAEPPERNRFGRDWALWTKPPKLIAFMLSWDVIATLALVYAVSTARSAGDIDWARLAGLAACATLHIQLTRRQEERRRNRVSAVHIDLSGIWIFPAALLLPIHLTLLLLVVVRAQRWVNSRRPPYKFLFTSFTHAISIFAAQRLFDSLGVNRLLDSGTANSVRAFAFLCLIGLVYATVQALVIGAMLALGGTPTPTVSNVLGSKTDNLLELSTIGLGIIATILLVTVPPAVVILILISVVGNRLAEINQLQSEARTDPKTGIFNIRGWSESAERAISRAAKGEDNLAVLMIDLDHFKWINDTYGHPAGDDVLRNVAQTLDEVTRPNDIVGRFGGEEFLVLLPEIDKAATELAAERVRRAIEGLEVVTTDKRGGRAGIANRTASIGVALLPWHGSTLDSLLQAADAAVYEAKEAGRNQVRFAPAILPGDTGHPG